MSRKKRRPPRSRKRFRIPVLDEAKKRRVEETAQGILDARALYPDKSLAWLYDPDTMPKELREAHEANDKAVMDLYGFTEDMSEADIVAALFDMYAEAAAAADAAEKGKSAAQRELPLDL